MLSFSKYHGCGNDFIIIDGQQQHINEFSADSVRALCHRRLGIGADGILLLLAGINTDYSVAIYNSDGSRPEMCGNGLRCIGKYLLDHGQLDTAKTLLVSDKTLTVSANANGIGVTMPLNCVLWSISLNDSPIDEIHYVDTGVPHAVFFCERVDTLDLQTLGRSIRSHPHFAPRGVNVTAVQRTASDTLHIRTYERGVEAETLACGSGATAAALAANHLFHIPSPIDIYPTLQEKLTVSFVKKEQSFSQIQLFGPAVQVFEGSTTHLPNLVPIRLLCYN